MSHKPKDMVLRPRNRPLDKQMEALDRSLEPAEQQGRAGQAHHTEEAEAALKHRASLPARLRPGAATAYAIKSAVSR